MEGLEKCLTEASLQEYLRVARELGWSPVFTLRQLRTFLDGERGVALHDACIALLGGRRPRRR